MKKNDDNVIIEINNNNLLNKKKTNTFNKCRSNIINDQPYGEDFLGYDKYARALSYVLLSEHNDSEEHAYKLGKLLYGIKCHVNLIPVNPTTQGIYNRTKSTTVLNFQEQLKRFNIPSTLRIEKGIDINAGCGQLRSRIEL